MIVARFCNSVMLSSISRFKIYWPTISSKEEDVESQGMFESSSGGYRRLNRSGSGFTQNFTFFGILVGLVIIFSVFYLYTSASNDASTLRFELKSQSDYVTKLKNEVMDLNVKLEELRTSEVTCKESKAMLERQAEGKCFLLSLIYLRFQNARRS